MLYNRGMDLNEVAVFIKVIQSGSFSKAAKQLAMPNSTVSAKVSSLEKRLGLTLIQRTTRKLNVTPAGEAYFTRCLQGLEEIRAAEDEITAGQDQPKGLLRITAPADLGIALLPDLAVKFTKKYPLARLEMILTDRRVDLVAEGVDLAIRAGELKDSSLMAKKLGAVYFAPFASPAYLKAHGTPKTPSELKSHTCLQFAPFSGAPWKLAGPKGSVSIAIQPQMIANDLNVVKTLTLSGAGISLMPTFQCYPEVNNGKLMRILDDWRTPLSSVHFVYPAQKFVPLKLSAFMEMATDSIRSSLRNYEL